MSTAYNMELWQAIAIAEGMTKPSDLDHLRCAYQMIVDHGVAWTLTPHVGQMAWKLIDAGEVKSQTKTTNKRRTNDE